MRAIVTGASGMLGNALVRHLRGRDATVEGWSHLIPQTPDGIEFRQVDLRKTDAAVDALRNFKPDLIVNCAAMTDVDACEEDQFGATKVNARAPAALAETAEEIGARFIQVSTDAVYDGNRPGRRRESERSRPGSVYAKTKLEGESRVLAANPEALVVRTTMFGWTLPDASRPKFAEVILGALSARKPMRLFSDAIFSPLHVRHLARALTDLAGTSAVGIMNVGSRRPVSKAEFGYLIADAFGFDRSFLLEGSLDDAGGFVASRPKNVGLDVSWLTEVLGKKPLSTEAGISLLYLEAFDGTAETIRGREGYP